MYLVQVRSISDIDTVTVIETGLRTVAAAKVAARQLRKALGRDWYVQIDKH